MRILLLDIETTPHTVYVWGLFNNQSISPDNIEETGSVLCWAAKWHGEKEMLHASRADGHKRMLVGIHKLLTEADVVVHYNGTKFDIPKLNAEFVKYGMSPPAPYKQVDLYRQVKQTFKFASNKLSFVAEQLGLEKKKKAEYILWIRAMHGDTKALNELIEYNKQDVVVLEELYNRIIPWVDQHPNHSAFEDKKCCPKCGSGEIQRRGRQVSRTAVYARFQCLGCGGWFRDNKRLLQSKDPTTQIRQ